MVTQVQPDEQARENLVANLERRERLWLAYLPEYIARPILAQPHTNPIGQEQRFDVVALFADISGFTAISEELGQSGARGTEELTEILNSYFGPMIDLIRSYGGIVAKFGGDAMTLIFPFTSETKISTLHRSLRCAMQMQAAMDRYAIIPTSAGVFSLGMKVGLAMGQVFATTVGDPAIRLEHILAGSVLDRCAEAEHHANRGEVVVDNVLLEHLTAVEFAAVETEGGHSGYSRIIRLLDGTEAKAQPMALEMADSIPSTFARYLHPLVARRLEEQQTDLINEHRRVTVLFATFTGFDYDQDAQVGEKIQRYLLQVIHIVQRYDGYLDKVDMGDKGSKFVVLFGAPVAHEDDPERAIRCGLELLTLPESQLHIGINTGFVFCGQMGASQRREYTVIGEPVNLAARLMQAAQRDQVLVSVTTSLHAAAAFHWGKSTTLMVKGRSTPLAVVPALSVQDALAVDLQEPAYTMPMLGRRRELQLAQQALQTSKASQGQLLGISGEAGMGKSRLVGEIAKDAIEQGFTLYAGACQSYGVDVSYLVWRNIWRGFFGLSANWSRQQQLEHLETALAALAPRLAQRIPLLGVVLNLPIADNALTSLLDAQLRAELLRSLLLECLRLRAQQGPLFFILEDCHWIDPLSQELLTFLARNLTDLPILMVMLYRPLDKGGDPLQWKESTPSPVQVLHLDELNAEDAATLTRLKFSQLRGWDSDISPQVIEKITAKAQGNPFYLEETVHLLHSQGIDAGDAHALDMLQIPDSLHSLILSRIDRLTEGEKTTLKVASVIGRLFKARWVWGSYPQAGAAEMVQGYLQNLSRLELTPLERSVPELEYIFKHITTQEVAYESLAFATRAALNENIGHFIEERYAHELAQYVNELAHYYGRTRNIAKQCIYFRLAGDAAKAAYANQPAIDYYQRLLPLLPEDEQAAVRFELGEIWQLTGEWDEAEAAYRHALAWSENEGDLSLRARSQTALGSLVARTQSYEEALTWFDQARQGFEQVGDRRGAGRVMEQLSFAYTHLGDYDQAVAYAEQQLQIATELNEQADISAALDYLGVAYVHKGDLEQAMLHLQRALDVAVQSGDRRRVILACNDLAGICWEQGDYNLSITYLQRAATVADEIDYKQAMSWNLTNLASIYGQAGELEQALRCAGQALAVALELGDWPEILHALGSIAMTLQSQTRYEEAEVVHSRVIDLSRTLNSPYELCAFLYAKADLYRLQNRYAESQMLAQEALNIAEQVYRRDVLFDTVVLMIHLRLATQQIDQQKAVSALESLLAEWTDEAEQATLHYEIWRVDQAQQSSQTISANLYRGLYARKPDILYHQRYETLTGKPLSRSASLPPILLSIHNISVDLVSLLQRAGVQF